MRFRGRWTPSHTLWLVGAVVVAADLAPSWQPNWLRIAIGFVGCLVALAGAAVWRSDRPVLSPYDPWDRDTWPTWRRAVWPIGWTTLGLGGSITVAASGYPQLSPLQYALRVLGTACVAVGVVSFCRRAERSLRDRRRA